VIPAIYALAKGVGLRRSGQASQASVPSQTFAAL
jgi:hypothetical protein